MSDKLSQSQYIARHESLLKQLLNSTNIPATRIKQATDYCLLSGGKRFRPLLVYLCGRMLNVDIKHLDIIGVAIEIIHCYSLVHDDLPAMDNDDLRRGKPSCHRAFDEATAILVGDGLQPLALEILLTHLKAPLLPQQILQIARELVTACGFSGMISGQSMDLNELTNHNVTEERLSQIHLLKTGKLIRACLRMVLAASNASEAEISALEQFAQHLGLVFQMQDDYLDCYDQHNQLGKGRASDTENHKITYASFYSKPDLQQLIALHFTHVENSLALFAEKAEPVIRLVNSLSQRTL